jgi:hypothetical protein
VCVCVCVCVCQRHKVVVDWALLCMGCACTRLTRTGLRELLGRPNLSALEILDISNNPMGDRGARELALALPVCAP